jgi:hypothetical protein
MVAGRELQAEGQTAGCRPRRDRCKPRGKLEAENCGPWVLNFRLALCRKILKVGRGTARQVALVALDYIGYGSRQGSPLQSVTRAHNHGYPRD